MKNLNILISLAAATAFAAFPAFAHEGHEEQAGEDVTVRGEVVDMACYIDHNATGPEHLDCAKTCIKMGLPVGIKADDGKTYLLIGETQANQL
jgi:type 1 fimbria pilin